jgi:hypothetical protein
LIVHSCPTFGGINHVDLISGGQKQVKMQNYSPKIKNTDNSPFRAKKAENRSVLGGYCFKKQSQFSRVQIGAI